MKNTDKNIILAPEKIPQMEKKDTDALIAEAIAMLKESNPDTDTDKVQAAYDFSKSMHTGQMRKSGDPYIVFDV